MQIRVSPSGRKIQALRSIYLPEKKRSTQKIALTFPCYLDQIPQSALDGLPDGRKLNEEEIKQVQTWLDTRKADQEDLRLKMSVKEVSRSIDLAAKGITGNGITKEQAQAIYNSFDTLAKALRKAGFARIKKVTEKPAKKEPVVSKKAQKQAKPASKKKASKKTNKKTVGKRIKKTARKKTTGK